MREGKWFFGTDLHTDNTHFTYAVITHIKTTSIFQVLYDRFSLDVSYIILWNDYTLVYIFAMMK